MEPERLRREQEYVIALERLAACALEREDWVAARALYEEALTIQDAVGDRVNMVVTLSGLGSLAFREGQIERAWEMFLRLLHLCRETGERQGAASCLEGIAAISAINGDAVRAVRLFGASAALREAMQLPCPPNEREEIERKIQSLRDRLGGAAFAREWQRGSSMTLVEALTYAADGSERTLSSPAG